VLFAGWLVLWGAATAWGQGFSVDPMRVDLFAPPGTVAEAAVAVRNALTVPQNAEVEPVMLGQSREGVFQALAPDSTEDTSPLRSCLPWLKVDSPLLKLGPLGFGRVALRLQVPRGARGSYSAGLLVRSQTASAGPGGLGIVIQFLIPVIVNVQGPVAQERVELVSATLRESEPEARGPQGQTPGGQTPTTEFVLTLRNSGETFVRLGGAVRVLLQQGERWVPVAEIPAPDRGLLPGIEAEYVSDLKRRLPGGTYRLEGYVTGGGRRVAVVAQTVELQGESATAPLAVDVPLDFAAQTVLEVSPGGTRSASVTMRNPSTDSVEVTTSLHRPVALRGANLPASTEGPTDASGWLEVTPAAFTLRAGGQMNLRITATVPETQAPVANSYAVLRLTAQHEGGQSASESQGLLIIHDPHLESKSAAEAISLALNHQEGNMYAVTARFVNTGNVQWKPTCRAWVAPAVGAEVAAAALETESTTVLPTGACVCSGVLDFSSVKAGAYLLQALMTYDKQEMGRELPLKVEVDEKGNRVVSVISSEAVSTETIAPKETTNGF
jgi:thioesterase domain-containing protein